MTPKAKAVVWDLLEWVILLSCPLAALVLLLVHDTEPPEEYASRFGVPAIAVLVAGVAGLIAALWCRGTCIERIEALAPDRWRDAVEEIGSTDASVSIEKALKRLVVEGILADPGDPAARRAFVLYQSLYWLSVTAISSSVVFLFWIDWLD